MKKPYLDEKINGLVGEYLRKKRLERGLTGIEVGQLLLISQQQVSRYERGENAVSLGLVLYFLKTLGLSVDAFFHYLLTELEPQSVNADRALTQFLNSVADDTPICRLN